MVLRIALDMDDTLAGTLRHIFRVYRRPVPKIWSFYNAGSISYDKFMRDVKSTWERHWGEVSPVEPGQAAMVDALREIGTVDIVTVGFPGPKSEWLRLHGVQYDEMVSVREGKDKAKLDYDIFIDDSPANFQSFKEAGKQCILFDAEYNRSVRTEFRIKSLAEAASMVCAMASVIHQRTD